MKTDFLVIGSGIAGLSFALKVAGLKPDATITIITKSIETEGSTKHAQGGIAVVTDFNNDSFEEHIKDTLLAGDGLCKSDIVRFVVKEAPKRFKELLSYGANFDINEDKQFDLAKEGGHSSNRIIHKQDCTGLEIVNTLLDKISSFKNIEIKNHLFATDLIVKNNKCCGAYVLNEDTGDITSFLAKKTLLATGGVGQVFKFTTNPLVSTGDGIAMAKRAGVEISDMEFVQFHPTALYNPNLNPSFLVSEAVRGEGAILRTVNGKEFMKEYHKDKELATRDIVARAIDTEIKKTIVNYVFLDCTNIPLDSFNKHFPNIKSKCEELDLDISIDLIPVIPAAHFICGGIETDINGKTSLENLYACGECANTGLNGANRLASNSLLESLVFSHQSAIDAINSFQQNLRYSEELIIENNKEEFLENKIKEKILDVKRVMSKNVGVFTDNNRLRKANVILTDIKNEIDNIIDSYRLTKSLLELQNIITVSLLIVNQSLERKENRGVYYNIDLVK